MVVDKFAVYSSPIGEILISHCGDQLTRLKILVDEPSDRGVADSFSDIVFHQVVEYLTHRRRCFDVKIDLSGVTPFQRKVFGELLKIPYGQRRSYKEIATAIGDPKACRAVGMANNRNPIHIIIPCHRVVGSRGALTGYAAGVEVKEFLLQIEGLG